MERIDKIELKRLIPGLQLLADMRVEFSTEAVMEEKQNGDFHQQPVLTAKKN